MPRRWSALWANMTLVWYLSLWVFAVFACIAAVRQDARFFSVDFTGFFFFYGIVCLIYIFCTEIVPPFWWLVTLPWRLRSRTLAAVGVVAVVALWLTLLLAVIPRYYGPSVQLVCAIVSELVVIALYRFVRYRRRKQRPVVEDALN